MWLRHPPKLPGNWRENSSRQKIRGNSSIEQLHYNQEGANWRSWAAVKLINTCCESDEATCESLPFVLNVTVDRIVSVVSWRALQYWFFYYLVWSALVHGVPPVTNCHIYVVLSNMFSFWGWRSFNHVQLLRLVPSTMIYRHPTGELASLEVASRRTNSHNRNGWKSEFICILICLIFSPNLCCTCGWPHHTLLHIRPL